MIANRQIDVWEIAYVWAWPMKVKAKIASLEDHFFHVFNAEAPLVNGAIPAHPGNLEFEVPARINIQVMDDNEIEARRDSALRFPRQVQHFGSLVDYILNTQDKPHLRRALQVYFDRLAKYYGEFAGPDKETH